LRDTLNRVLRVSHYPELGIDAASGAAFFVVRPEYLNIPVSRTTPNPEQGFPEPRCGFDLMLK